MIHVGHLESHGFIKSESHVPVIFDACGKKRCTKCLQFRDVSEFPKYDRSPIGLSPQCRGCMNKYTRMRFEQRKPEMAIYRKMKLEGKDYCPRCSQWKDSGEFPKAKNRNAAYCKPCKIEYGRNWQRNCNVERQYKQNKSRSLTRGRTFTLSLEEYRVLVSRPCHYCGGLLGLVARKSVGLDRIDNNKGYEPGNVLPCCECCNKTRNIYYTVEETKAMIGLVLEMRKKSYVSNVLKEALAGKELRVVGGDDGERINQTM